MPQAVILTALSVEYLAVRSHLDNLQEVMHPQGTIYERGHFEANRQTWDVGIAEVGAGNAGAAVEAERAIAYFKPDMLFFVGIAGGIKDVKIGDVVAATKVYGYESGKVDNTFSTRPAVGQSAYAVIQRARKEARNGDWVKQISNTVARKPKAYVAPIAAGEKVIASRESELFKFIRGSYNDAIAIEMEGFGFLSAAFAYPNMQAIVIRGISDLIKDKNVDDPEEGNEDERQERASRNASAFAFEVLSKLPAPEPSSSGEAAPSPQSGQMVQNNTDQAKGFQTLVEGGTAYIGGEIHIHNHPSSEGSNESQGSAQSEQSNSSKSSFETAPQSQIGQPVQSPSEPSSPQSSAQTGPSLNLPPSAQTMSTSSTPKKVFISYSHDSPEHKDKVLELADQLREDGLDANIDQYEDSPPEGWPRWMMNQVEGADYVLVVCTEQYDRRFRGREEQGKGKGGTWEGAIITQELYDAQGYNSDFIPIVLASTDKEHIPLPLRSATSYRLYNDDGYEQLYRRLTNQHDTPRPDLGQQRTLAPRERKQLFQEKPKAPDKLSNSQDKINLFDYISTYPVEHLAYFVDYNQAFRLMPFDLGTIWGLQRSRFIGLLIGVEPTELYENLRNTEFILGEAVKENQAAHELAVMLRRREWIQLDGAIDVDSAIKNSLANKTSLDTELLGFYCKVNLEQLNIDGLRKLQKLCRTLLEELFPDQPVAVVIHIIHPVNQFLIQAIDPAIEILKNQLRKITPDTPIELLRAKANMSMLRNPLDKGKLIDNPSVIHNSLTDIPLNNPPDIKDKTGLLFCSWIHYLSIDESRTHEDIVNLYLKLRKGYSEQELKGVYHQITSRGVISDLSNLQSYLRTLFP